MTSGEALPTRRQVLVVEDDFALRELISRTITIAGFDVVSAIDVGSALEVAGPSVSVAVLDVMLPDGSGFDLAGVLRGRFPGLGILFLTARDALEDRLTGFAFGADDYLTKPFSVAELVARLSALHRRVGEGERVLIHRPIPDEGRLLVVGDVVLDQAGCTVARAGLPVELSPTEFRLLRYLMLNADVVVSKDQIIAEVWGYDHVGDVGIVEKFVSQLRRKLDHGDGAVISTVRGFGYAIRTAGS